MLCIELMFQPDNAPWFGVCTAVPGNTDWLCKASGVQPMQRQLLIVTALWQLTFGVLQLNDAIEGAHKWLDDDQDAKEYKKSAKMGNRFTAQS